MLQEDLQLQVIVHSFKSVHIQGLHSHYTTIIHSE